MCEHRFFDPSSGMSMPGFGGGVRNTEGAKTGKTEFNFDFGFNKAGNVGGLSNPLEITRTTVTPEQRIEENTQVTSQALASVAEQADYDRQVDEFFKPYLANLNPKDVASMSFNAQMAMYPMDNFVA